MEHRIIAIQTGDLEPEFAAALKRAGPPSGTRVCRIGLYQEGSVAIGRCAAKLELSGIVAGRFACLYIGHHLGADSHTRQREITIFEQYRPANFEL
jgi:hypothetical protein